jgi:hypothetical protein
MPIKDFVALESPPASDFNRYFMQQEFIRKTSNESVANTTTVQDDDVLFFTPILNTDYWITMYIIYDGPGPSPTEADLKISWSVPTGSTFDYVSDAITSGATSGVYDVSRTAQIAPSGGTPGAGTLGTTSPAVALVKGLFRMGSTAGTFRFRWAQITAHVTAVTVRANSVLIARRLTT